MSVVVMHTSNASRRRHLARARRYAAEHAERLIVIVKRPTWEAEFADQVVVADTADIPATIAAVRALAPAGDPVRGVVALVEHSVPAAAAVATALGLPTYGPRAARLARDKVAMRAAFDRAALRQPGFATVASLAAARDAAARIGYPVVLKPVLGGGSKHVRRVDDEAQLAKHFDALRQRGWDGAEYDPLWRQTRDEYGAALLLEGFVAGAEVSVESVVADGVTRVVAVHDKPLPMDGPLFPEVYFATPSRMPADVLDRISAATDRAHRALGITMGVTHTEFRVDTAGRPYVLESAGRLGGGPVYRSVLFSTGVDLVEAALDLATGRPPTLPSRPADRPVGFCMVFADRPGRVRAVHGLDRLRDDPRVRDVEVYCAVGDRVDVPPRVSQAHGHVIFTGAEPAELDATFQKVVRTLRIEAA